MDTDRYINVWEYRLQFVVQLHKRISSCSVTILNHMKHSSISYTGKVLAVEMEAAEMASEKRLAAA